MLMASLPQKLSVFSEQKVTKSVIFLFISSVDKKYAILLFLHLKLCLSLDNLNNMF